MKPSEMLGRGGQRVKPSEMLDKAADYVLEHGMTRGALKDPETGAVCAYGALYAVQGTADWRNEAVPFVYRRAAAPASSWLSSTLFTEVGDVAITEWNDWKCKDKEQLAQMLRLAAKNAEANGC